MTLTKTSLRTTAVEGYATSERRSRGIDETKAKQRRELSAGREGAERRQRGEQRPETRSETRPETRAERAERQQRRESSPN